MKPIFYLLLALSTCLICVTVAKARNTVITVQPLGDMRMTITALVGLLNRDNNGPVKAYSVIRGDSDWFWLNETIHSDNNGVLERYTPVDFIKYCMDQQLVKTRVLYDSQNLPSYATSITLAGIYDGIVLSIQAIELFNLYDLIPELKDLPIHGGKPVSFKTDYDAMSYSLDHLLHNTSTTKVAYMRVPQLIDGYLIDYIVQNKLFVISMENICEPGTKQHRLFHRMLRPNPHWDTSQPLSVMGYHSGTFECIATCTVEHSEVSFVTDVSSGLSYFSRLQPVLPHELKNPPIRALKYNSSKTYVAVVNSDGDNLQLVHQLLMQHMRQRAASCADPTAACPPLSWTISARAMDHAPNYLRFFYKQAVGTGRDSFLLPPSGYGYIYPALIKYQHDSEMLRNYTAAAAEALDMSAYVHWDWEFTFDTPRSKRFIRSFNNSAIKGVFLGVVPWVLPQLHYKADQMVGDVAVFQETIRWASNNIDGKNWSPPQMADFLNGLKANGSLHYVYKFADVDYYKYDAMAKLLNPHVQLVDYRELIDLAQQKYQRQSHQQLQQQQDTMAATY